MQQEWALVGNLEAEHSGKVRALKIKGYKFKGIEDHQRNSVLQVGFPLRK